MFIISSRARGVLGAALETPGGCTKVDYNNLIRVFVVSMMLDHDRFLVGTLRNSIGNGSGLYVSQ